MDLQYQTSTYHATKQTILLWTGMIQKIITLMKSSIIFFNLNIRDFIKTPVLPARNKSKERKNLQPDGKQM